DSDAVGLPPGFALTVRVAVFMPGGATGVHTTDSVHVPPVISVFPLHVSVLVVIANSVEPLMAVVIVPVVAPPMFVTVNVCAGAGVLPICTVPYDGAVGVMVSEAAVTAVPPSATDTGPPGEAFSVSVPDLTPMVAGWKTTLIVQGGSPGLRAAPQLLDE